MLSHVAPAGQQALARRPLDAMGLTEAVLTAAPLDN